MAYKTPAPGNITVTQYDVLVGDVANGIASVGPGSSGQALKSGGNAANPSYTTATFPSTATGTGKILRADGTNWVATTATYPDTAGTSGNILTSDGTNWSSTTPAASGLGYTLRIANTSTSNPADGQTYIMVNNSFNSTTDATSSITKMFVPFAGTVTKVYGSVTVQGTLGSSENCSLYLRQNNTTDNTISTTYQLTSANNPFNATFSISVAAGDYLQFKFVTPTWTTNPTTVTFSGTVYIE